MLSGDRQSYKNNNKYTMHYDNLGRQRLRSSSTSALAVPMTQLTTINDQAFPITAART